MPTRLLRGLPLLVLLFGLLLPAGAPQPARAAGVPFSDGFEAASLGADWSTSTSGNGVFELTSDYEHSGSQAVFLGQKTAGSATASLVLALDLSGRSDVFLDFWARITGSTERRRISISDNAGASWSEISSLDALSSSYGHFVFDLATLASTRGLALNSQFRLRFTYSNDATSGQAGDGMAIDDLRLVPRAQAIAGFPLARQSFETAALPQGFYAYSFNSAVAELSTDYYRSGGQALFLGQRTGGPSSAWLIMPIDLSGQSDVFLDFWARSTGGGERRRVYISDNSGASWTEIAGLDNIASSWGHISIDLSNAAASSGLALNNQFRLGFNYSNDATAGDAGDGLVIDDLRLTSRAQAAASFPLATQGFEEPELAEGIYMYSSYTAIAELSRDYARSGAQAVFLGQRVNGASSASLVLVLDLTGQASVYLDFWVRATGAGEQRRVYISDNSGASWTEIANLDNTSQSFKQVVIKLSDVATSKGLALNDKFLLRFSFFDDATAGNAGDGMVIDDLRLGTTDPVSEVYLPLVRR